MRVALVGDRPPPHGGISVHVEGLSRALRAAGVTVEIVDTAHAPTHARFAASLAGLVARGFLLHVHTSGHNAKSWALAFAGALARRPWAGNVITLHSGLLCGYLVGAPKRRLAARAALAGYGRIVAVNREIAKALEASGVGSERIATLPAFLADGLRLEDPPLAFAAIRSRHAHLVACALAPSPIYGAPVLWAALGLLRRRMGGLGCAVFGPGTAELAAPVRDAGLGEVVHLLGELPHGQALGVMAKSDTFARPSLADGDALSVREALALGVPVVASDVVTRPSGVDLFPVGDPFELASRLERALSTGRARPAKETDAFPELFALYQRLGSTGKRGPAGARRL